MFVEQWTSLTIQITKSLTTYVCGSSDTSFLSADMPTEVNEIQHISSTIQSSTSTLNDNLNNNHKNKKNKHRLKNIDLTIYWAGNTTNNQLKISHFTPHALKFVWGRLVNLIGNPNRMVFHGSGAGLKDAEPVSPAVFASCLSGISENVDAMLQIGNSTSSAVSGDDQPATTSGYYTQSGRYAISAVAFPPRANTILRVYGAWLFDASLTKRAGYEKGKARAIECLGNILCTPHARNMRDLDPSMRTRYVMAVDEAVGCENDEVLASVISGSRMVLGTNIPGIRILTDTLNRAIMKILSQDQIAPEAHHTHTIFRRNSNNNIDDPQKTKTTQSHNFFGTHPLSTLRSHCLTILSSQTSHPHSSQVCMQLLTAYMYTEQNALNLQKVSHNKVNGKKTNKKLTHHLVRSCCGSCMATCTRPARHSTQHCATTSLLR